MWSEPAFSADVAALRREAEAVKRDKHSEATVLLSAVHFDFDPAGKLVETHHLIYRVENQEGVRDWAEASGQWDAWHQEKPIIKARVIAPDSSVHWLDPKTLSDVPIHQNAPEVYSDERRYGGPLPAVAPGAIVEEEVTVRDTAPLFAAGTAHRWRLAWSVPVNRTLLFISHPESLPLRYQTHLLPDATITRSVQDHVETIALDQGPMAARTEQVDYAPADQVLYPEIEFSTGTSWQGVAAAYARLSDEKVRVSDVQALLGKINVKDGSRLDVIRRLVASLHRNVRYTGVEFGESSLIPQFPSETLKRSYGDCKDKAVFLVAMLRGAGIPAYLALLDSGPGRDINTTLPGMGVFDHAIVYVPPAGPDPELWIDATAQYSQVGTLPWMDYGRSALIIDVKTESLQRTPEITADKNVHRETREFTLAEYGPSTIVETDDEIGPEEADYRAFYSGDAKEVKENSENYVKEMYLADSLTSLEHGDLSDLDKPASIKFVTKGRRGNTDLDSALIAIRVETLFGRVPRYFSTKENEKKTDEKEDTDSEKPPERTADWWITPFTTEWRYKVIAPAGFKLRALPSNKIEKVNVLNFSQQYSANPEGTVVEAVLRVESTATRLTVQQARDLRDVVLKVRASDPIFITFDNVGHALIQAGKIKEGLAAYRQIAGQHPSEAVHKVQLAQALLSAGLGEEARAVALQATTLEPNSALAFSTLGTVLKHDLIGRPAKKGMDLNGAVAAYRKAIKLDPKDKEIRTNLALLLEYDADGTRYGGHAALKDAVAELHDLKKLDEEYARTYNENILYDLWYAHDYQALLDYASTLPASDAQRGLTLAATAIEQGTEAAVKKSLEITTDDRSRGQALLTAGTVLNRVRKYREGSVLLAEGARGHANESQIMRGASVFAKTRPYEEVNLPASDPSRVIQELFGEMLSGKLTLEKLRSLLYRGTEDLDEALDEKAFQRMMSKIKAQAGVSGVPLNTIADIAVSNMRYAVDGDDALGYKITVESPGAPPQEMFVARDGKRYAIAGFSTDNSSAPETLGVLVLQELEKNNLVAARTWLDRARDKIHIAGGDDPLAGAPFPYFWTKGQEPDATTMRTAALVLLPSKAIRGTYLTALDQARRAAKTEIERARLTMVLAYAYAAAENWADMLPVAEELVKSSPTSVRAFEMTTMAYARLKRFDDWDRLVQVRLHDHPDELAYTRSLAMLARYRGDFAKSREIIKTIIDKGQATGGDLNDYAWYALLVPGAIEQETLDLAARANDLTKNSSFAILHTLACVDAQAGKTSQARELLLKAMDALQIDEPNSEVWFGFGMIAEQYGVLDAAEKIYGRVEKPKIDSPGSTYSIAQQHLAGLHSSGKSAAKPLAP